MYEAPLIKPARDYDEAVRALSDKRRYRRWSAELKAAHSRKIAGRTSHLLRFQIFAGLAAAAFSLGWDLLVMPEHAEFAVLARLLTVVPLACTGLYLLSRRNLQWAKAMVGASIVCLGMVAMHLASFGGEALMTRYVMATSFLLGIACLALPFSPAELRKFALAFALGTGLAALWPNPLEPLIAATHIAFVVLIGGISVAVAQNYWEIDARGFLKDLREEATREALRHSNRLLQQLSERDPLTGSLNRRGFERVFDKLIVEVSAVNADRLDKDKVSIGRASVMMIDLDHFKRFNDTHGHQAGDTCLTLVARALEDVFGKTQGFVARFGGEEFIAALRETQPGEALAIAEEVRVAVAELLVPLSGAGEASVRPPLVTTSVGIGLSDPITRAIDADEGRALREDLIEMADAALYSAKRAGRNRVEIVTWDEPLSRSA